MIEGLLLALALVALLVLRDLVIRWLADRADERSRGVSQHEARLVAVEATAAEATKLALSAKKAVEATHTRVRR